MALGGSGLKREYPSEHGGSLGIHEASFSVASISYVFKTSPDSKIGAQILPLYGQSVRNLQISFKTTSVSDICIKRGLSNSVLNSF